MARPRKTDGDPGIGTKSWRKWSPRGWLSDTQLRLCSLAARGLWIDILNLMMESVMVGYLVGPDKKPMPLEDISNIARIPVDEVRKLLEELKERRVYSVDAKGRIFNRRIIREEKNSETGAISAEKRWGKSGDNQGVSSKPMGGPMAKPNARERERDRYSFQNKGGGDFVGGKRTGSGKAKAPWTLDQKREFGWQKVAAAIGDGGWEVVEKAAGGDSQAIHACKRIARELGVTWYAGKPEVGKGST